MSLSNIHRFKVNNPGGLVDLSAKKLCMKYYVLIVDFMEYTCRDTHTYPLTRTHMTLCVCVCVCVCVCECVCMLHGNIIILSIHIGIEYSFDLNCD